MMETGTILGNSDGGSERGVGAEEKQQTAPMDLLANSPLPSGNNEEVRGGQKQQRGQGHTMEERQV